MLACILTVFILSLQHCISINNYEAMMIKKKLLSFLLFMFALTASAESYTQELKLHVDSMPAALVENPSITLFSERREEPNSLCLTPAAAATDVSKAVKPYKFMDDMTFVGVPLFVAGIIAKSEKKSFRQINEDGSNKKVQLIKYNFHSEIDNYTQFAPMLLATGLNLAGVEGRSNFWRYLASGAMSYAIMAAIVNPIKYTAKEMRPDGSTRNSWPSGHTATAFVSATILHKEYGLTRSPWYSFAGYGIATATGVMRVLNNRHWVSDVLSGAGIGIFSTELAYGLSDLIFKGKGLKRNDLANTHNIIENPSFFSISMGIGLGSKSMDFDGASLGLDDDVHLKFQASTVVGAEAAYFFNKYVGVGGRLRVKSTPIKGWSGLTELADKEYEDMTTFKNYLVEEAGKSYPEYKDQISSTLSNFVDKKFNVTIEQDHITEFAGDVGVYFNFPLSSRFAIGTKALIGRSIIQDLDINAEATGRVINDDFSVGEEYDEKWDYFTLSGNNTWKYGTGISLTYAYKSSFSWRVFVDYDFTRKTYSMTYDGDNYVKVGWPWFYDLAAQYSETPLGPQTQTIKKNMNSFVIGGAFCISF